MDEQLNPAPTTPSPENQNPQLTPGLPPDSSTGPHTPIVSVTKGIPSKKSKKLILGLIIIIVLALIAGAAWYFLKKDSSQATKSQTTKTTAATISKLCFTRLSHLVCVNEKGENRERFDMPQIKGHDIGYLIASPDGSQYLTTITTASVGTYNDPNELWVLDSKLGTPKQIQIPTGDTIISPSWSHDGKSIFAELNDSKAAHDVNRQIYKISLSGGAPQKLTKDGLNTKPIETKDGHIIYSNDTSYPGSTTWSPFVMNADGSNPKALIKPVDFVTFTLLDYDFASDMVYITKTGNTPTALYGSASDFIAGKQTKQVKINMTGLVDQILRISDSKIALFKGAIVEIIDVNSGAVETTIKQVGSSIGDVNTNGLTKSAAQTEDPHERIANLASAPDDFKTFITAEFDKKEAECVKSKDYTGEIELNMGIIKVVRDTFASVNIGACGGGGAMYGYAKANNTWAQAFATQMILDCSTVNKYKFTKEIIPECMNASNTQVKNANP